MRQASRRDFLRVSLGGSIAALGLGHASAEPKSEISFFLVGDTHYLADKENPQNLDPRSAATNDRLIDVLNRLPGTRIPDTAGGGEVIAPAGVIHAGDVIDSGDKNGGAYARMQETEWQGFASGFGHTGRDGRLQYPVYEVHGNHDGPCGKGLVIDGIIQRNKSRPGLASVSKNGLHYSWDWGGVHIVNLGIVVGQVKSVSRKRRYQPLESLDFLVTDLADSVGDSGRPVFLTHHIDVARYSTAPNPDGPASSAEWDPADVRGYYEAIQGYNIAAILYGHTHARNIYQWDGSPKKAAEGMSVFNVDNSAHFASDAQAMFYFQLRNGEMIVRELATRDRWQTAEWTPQFWSRKLAAKS